MSAMSEKFPQLFSGLAVLSVAIVMSAWIGGNAVQRLKSADNTISVTGSARKAIKSDYGVWSATVSAERPTQKEAYNALQGYLSKAKDYLVTEKQVPATSLAMGELVTTELQELLPNGNPSGKTRAYQLSQTIEVRLPDPERIRQLSQESSELVTRDIPFESNEPQYLYTKLSDLRVQMLAEATQDARSRAEQIVKTAGSGLGPVRSVWTGVFQITKPNSTEVSGEGMYDTTSIDKDITAVLTMNFAVE